MGNEDAGESAVSPRVVEAAAMDATEISEIRHRAIRLVEYLRAARAVREKPVRDIAAYQDRRLWPDDVPNHPSCSVGPAGAGPWLRAVKPIVPPAPPVPERLAAFIPATQRDPDAVPALPADLADRIGNEAAGRLYEQLDEWLAGGWGRWADEARAALAARRFYETLYDLRLRLQRDEATHELIWGHGVLSWRAAGHANEPVMYPLVATRMVLDYDAETGQVSVSPEGLGQIELEALQGLDVRGFETLVALREAFREEPEDLWDGREARALFDRLLRPLNPGGDAEVLDAARPPSPGTSPTVTTGWVLFVRRRSTMYQRFFEALHQMLADEKAIPAPLASIVADDSSTFMFPWESQEVAEWAQVGERLLLPLATNDEQERIAKQLAHHRGVTTQGPPGTGKTHTIANLVSHLVGHGKRVLVTSHKEQPLAVLRDKLPEEIRDLCVSVLGSSSISLAQLDQSVQAIYGNSATLDQRLATASVAALFDELDMLNAEIARLRTRIRQVAERERETYDLGGRARSPSELGRWLTSKANDLAFIPDRLNSDHMCPLTTGEVARLFQLAATIEPRDRTAAVRRLPKGDELARGADLAGAEQQLREVRDRLVDVEDTVGEWSGVEKLGEAGLVELIRVVETSANRLDQIEVAWVRALRNQVSPSGVWFDSWRETCKAIREGIGEIATWTGELAGHQVVMPGGTPPAKEFVEQLRQLRERYAAGRRVSRLLHRALFDVREACSLDGECPNTVEDIDLLLCEAGCRRRRYELVTRWDQAVAPVGGAPIDPADPFPEYKLDISVRIVEDALAWEDEEAAHLRIRLADVVADVPARPNAAELREIVRSLRLATERFAEQRLVSERDGVRRQLSKGASGSDASDLWLQLSDRLEAHDWPGWDAARAEARRLLALRPQVDELNDLAERLEPFAPLWTAMILDRRSDASTGSPALAFDAWQWRQAETWLQSLITAEDPTELQRKLEELLRRAQTVTVSVTAESAWLAVAAKLTGAERAALIVWSQSLKKVGKGTGRYAPKWRAEAQSAMKRAVTAVPVWIMPIWRVVESFDPLTTPPFDVVIVDESSQCDLFSIAVLGMAKKAIVVGDDKQISPQAIGLDQSVVHDLIKEHISDLPNSALLDPTSSLYDIAKRTFPGVIMLKEHFRCLPEIIQFSNDLSYNGEILPLREDSADSLGPPTVARFVADGFRDPGTDINKPEADALIDTVSELVANPAYDRKTLGIISFLSGGQAQYIQAQLVERLGEQEMERRNLRVGDAYNFQGDERDVVLISLVVAGERVGAMTKESDRQRVNVAASRARDQMWVFHSVSSDQFHPDDVRARLIRHCADPHRVGEDYRNLADRCESDFERDVLRQLVARRYAVSVQHRVGSLRIDMVVQGMRDRLAIECDGDAYHREDRWDADRRRQEILERLGWKFFRVRGSSFYRHPEPALQPLWDRLEALGIYPDDGRSRVPKPMTSPGPTPLTGPPSTAETVTADGVDPEPLVVPDREDGLAYAPASPQGGPSVRATVAPPSSAFPRFQPSAHERSMPDAASDPVSEVWVGAQQRAEASWFSKAAGERDATVASPSLRSAPQGGGAVRLEPYRGWTPSNLKDATAAGQSEIIAGLVDIVAAEGPVLGSRAYLLYVRAAGGQRVGKLHRQALNRAAAAAVRQGLLEADDHALEEGQMIKTLRRPGTPQVVIRGRGDRDLEDIPLTEIAGLISSLRETEQLRTPEEIKRRVLDLYERSRLSASASAYLDQALRVASLAG